MFGDLNVPHLELIIDVVTRWNSSFGIKESKWIANEKGQNQFKELQLVSWIINLFMQKTSNRTVKILNLSEFEWEFLVEINELLNVSK